MDGFQLAMEAIKAFEAMKPGIEGALATGTLLTSTAKASIYVVQKGAKMISYLITRRKKEPAKAKTKAARKPRPASKVREEALVTKKDVAIIIDINRRSLTQVAEYLETKNIDADFILITNDPAYSDQIKMLKSKNPREWEAILKDLALQMTKIQKTVGSAKLHIFQSTPVALSFGLGCVWGTVHPATIYHYEEGTYYPVLQVKRAWKTG